MFQTIIVLSRSLLVHSTPPALPKLHSASLSHTFCFREGVTSLLHTMVSRHALHFLCPSHCVICATVLKAVISSPDRNEVRACLDRCFVVHLHKERQHLLPPHAASFLLPIKLRYNRLHTIIRIRAWAGVLPLRRHLSVAHVDAVATTAISSVPLSSRVLL